MSRSVATLIYSKKTGSAMRKSILAYMADRANDDGSGIWCSKQRIADEIEASRSSVISNIREMVAEGILVEIGKRQHQNGYTMEYSINISAILDLPDAQQEDPFKFVRVQQLDVTRPAVGHQDVRQLDINRPTTVLEPSTTAPEANGDVKDAFDFYNTIAPKAGWPRAEKLTSARKSALNARLKEFGLEDWKRVVLSAAELPWCCGGGGRKWHADIDYLSRESGFLKVYETLPKRSDLLSSAGEQKTTEASLLDSAFAFYAKTGNWKGRLDGFLYEPNEPEAEYPEALYAKYGLTKPGRAA